MHVSFPIVYFNVLSRKTSRDDLFCSNHTFSLVGYSVISLYFRIANILQNAECDDRLNWKLHTFVFHMEPLLSFRTIGALNSKLDEIEI